MRDEVSVGLQLRHGMKAVKRFVKRRSQLN